MFSSIKHDYGRRYESKLKNKAFGVDRIDCNTKQDIYFFTIILYIFQKSKVIMLRQNMP